jgi:hypothetical protein
MSSSSLLRMSHIVHGLDNFQPNPKKDTRQQSTVMKLDKLVTIQFY